MARSSAAEALLEQGLAHHHAQRLSEAARCYRDLIAVAPEHPDGLHLLGLVEHAAGDRAGALAHLRRAVQLRPEVAHYHANLGTVCLAAGDLPGAEASLRAALAAAPEQAEAWHNLGLALLAAGKPEQAEAALRAAVARAPHAADAHGNLGACLHRLDPGLEPAQACLGLVLEALGAPLEAEAAYRAALALRPERAANHTNLGNLLRAQGRPDAAEECLRGAAALRPQDADVWHNLAAVLAGQGRRAAAEAEACCHRALRLDPQHADAQYLLGTLALLAGRLPEGFAGLEWRWRRRGFAPPRSFAVPRWDGAPRHGRTLLLHAEQGLGDAIQMLRFVPGLAQAGLAEAGLAEAGLAGAGLAEAGPVVLEVPATLRALAERLDRRVTVVAAGGTVPPHDLECPLPSLPHALALDLPGIPDQVPYLHPDPAAVAVWAARVAALPGRRVGLVWAGNPAYAADARRSVPPARLGALAGLDGVSWVSLQPGAPPPRLAVHDWTDRLTTLDDTAALVACLDLVIAVDTAVAHLAGALGRPVWLLNRFDTDWRWLREGDTCPWYPTLRQFRQPAPGDWGAVLAQVRARLAACLSGEMFGRDA